MLAADMSNMTSDKKGKEAYHHFQLYRVIKMKGMKKPIITNKTNPAVFSDSCMKINGPKEKRPYSAVNKSERNNTLRMSSSLRPKGLG